MLTFARKSTDDLTNPDRDDFREAPLAAQSLLLLLVLVHHCTQQTNPYRSSLSTCVNSRGNTPVAPTKAAGLFKVDYDALYGVLCKRTTGDATTLLLYFLVHRNQAFKAFLLARLDLEQLVGVEGEGCFSGVMR